MIHKYLLFISQLMFASLNFSSVCQLKIFELEDVVETGSNLSPPEKSTVQVDNG